MNEKSEEEASGSVPEQHSLVEDGGITRFFLFLRVRY